VNRNGVLETTGEFSMSYTRNWFRRLAGSISLSLAIALTMSAGTAGWVAQAASMKTKAAPLNLVVGRVLSPDGSPVAHDRIAIYPADPPSGDPAMWYPIAIGTAMTNVDGKWSFVVPVNRSLPASLRDAADANRGWLNLITTAFGGAAVGKGNYEEEADRATSVWVGTQTTSPPAGTVGPAAFTMTMTPLQRDISSMSSSKRAAGTWASRASVMSRRGCLRHSADR
jgi:hypothetical protein